MSQMSVHAPSLLHRALTGMKVSGRSRAKKRYFQQEEKEAVHGGRAQTTLIFSRDLAPFKCELRRTRNLCPKPVMD